MSGPGRAGFSDRTEGRGGPSSHGTQSGRHGHDREPPPPHGPYPPHRHYDGPGPRGRHAGPYEQFDRRSRDWQQQDRGPDRRYDGPPPDGGRDGYGGDGWEGHARGERGPYRRPAEQQYRRAGSPDRPRHRPGRSNSPPRRGRSSSRERARRQRSRSRSRGRGRSREHRCQERRRTPDNADRRGGSSAQQPAATAAPAPVPVPKSAEDSAEIVRRMMMGAAGGCACGCACARVRAMHAANTLSSCSIMCACPLSLRCPQCGRATSCG